MEVVKNVALMMPYLILSREFSRFVRVIPLRC